MKIILTYLLLLIGPATFAQVNQKDAQGRKQGAWKKTYPGSTVLKYSGQFKDDKPVGKFIFYYESGSVQAVVVHRKDGKTSDAQLLHQSGYLMARGKYVNEKKDSAWVFYDDRGVISSQENYKNGELDGQRVVYYEPVNGEYRVAKYDYWKNGVRDGEYKRYHPNTELAEAGKWVNGKREGKVTHYWPNGRTQKVESWQDGKKHGFWITYDESGKSVSSKLYWDGQELKGEARKKKEAELKANR